MSPTSASKCQKPHKAAGRLFSFVVFNFSPSLRTFGDEKLWSLKSSPCIGHIWLGKLFKKLYLGLSCSFFMRLFRLGRLPNLANCATRPEESFQLSEYLFEAEIARRTGGQCTVHFCCFIIYPCSLCTFCNVDEHYGLFKSKLWLHRITFLHGKLQLWLHRDLA